MKEEVSNGRVKDEETPSLYPVQSRIQEPMSLLHEIAFVSIVCMSQLMTQASLAQTIVPTHIIGESFGTSDPGQLSWFPAAFSLTVGTFILPAGRLGDLFGHKQIFILGFIWYGVWTLAAGFSVYSHSSPILFDICRAFQGMGPAFLLPNSVAILGRTYEGQRKNMVFSIFGGTAPNGFLIGGVFTAIFAQLLWWPWTFWVGGSVGFVCAGLGYLIIPHTPVPTLDPKISIFALSDTLGTIAGVSGLVLVNFAFNQAPNIGWGTPYIYALLIVGVLFLAAFAYIESKAEYPLIPGEALTKDTLFILGCIAFGWATFGIWLYYFMLIQTTLQDVTPLLLTAHLTPVGISGVCAAITSGLLLHKLGAGPVMLIAMTAFTVGTILIVTLPIGQIYWAQVFVAIIIMPWGMDMSFPAASIIVSNQMKREHQGVAASLVNTVLNYSISLGLGLAGTVQVHIDPTGQNLLLGYRSALYLGIGLAGLGMTCAVAFIISSYFEGKAAARAEGGNMSVDSGRSVVTGESKE